MSFSTVKSTSSSYISRRKESGTCLLSNNNNLNNTDLAILPLQMTQTKKTKISLMIKPASCKTITIQSKRVRMWNNPKCPFFMNPNLFIFQKQNRQVQVWVWVWMHLQVQVKVFVKTKLNKTTRQMWIWMQMHHMHRVTIIVKRSSCPPHSENQPQFLVAFKVPKIIFMAERVWQVLMATKIV